MVRSSDPLSPCLRVRFSENCTTRLQGSLGFELKLVYSLQFVSEFEGPNLPNSVGESKFGCGNCEDQSGDAGYAYGVVRRRSHQGGPGRGHAHGYLLWSGCGSAQPARGGPDL